MNLLKLDSHWIVAASGWLARILTTIARLGVIVLLLNYLDVDHYAIYAVIVSLEGWFFLCDWGLGFSAQNFVSEARAKGASLETLLCSIMQLSLGLFALFLLLNFWLAPTVASFLFKNRPCSDHCVSAVFYSGLCFGLCALGTIAYRILYALQKGYWVHLLQTIGVLFSFGGIWVLTHHDVGEDKLLLSLVCWTGIPALIACSVFCKLFPLSRLFSYVCIPEIKALFFRSLQFFGSALGSVAVGGIDYIVMCRLVSSEEILLYNVISKMFVGFFVMHVTFMQAVWPVCSELATLQRFEELKKRALRYCWYGSVFVLVMTSVIILLSPALSVFFFAKQQLPIPLVTILLFGFYYLVRVFCDPYSTILQSMNQLKTLLFLVPCQALIGCVFQTLFAKKWGVNGIILGLSCSFLMTVSWVLPIVFYRSVRKNQRFVQEKAE